MLKILPNLIRKISLVILGIISSYVNVNAQVVTTFNYSGGTQTYTVPACVTSLSYVVAGAEGGGALGGDGAIVSGTLTVTPGQVLQIRVGGQGGCPAAGYNGGGAGINITNSSCGGGGASDIRTTPYGTAQRVVVAAGGGGQGEGNPTNRAGGAGGCAAGSNGAAGFGTAGTGGTQTAGGTGGFPYATPGSNGGNGALGVGGNGGQDNCTSRSHGGGGGGGYYGGGGGGPDCIGFTTSVAGSGGGGGSSLVPAGGSCTAGTNTGDGYVTITIPSAPTANFTSTSSNVCAGTQFNLTGNVTATGAWTLTLSNGQTTTGTGNGTWSITVSPTATTTYTITNIVDAVRCNPGTGSVTLTLPTMGTTLGTNNQSATCLVNQNGYVHFYHSTGRLLASINSQGQNLGNVTVTNYLDGANQTMPACVAPTNPAFATSVMQRHWVITPTIQPTTPVLVRLPFNNSELATLITVSGANVNTLDNVTGVGSLKLSKYSGPANVDNNAPNNCPASGGSAGTTIHGQVGSGLTTAYSSVINAQYSDHSIPSFSEFWLHGSSINSPLPILMEDFYATCDDAKNENKLIWSTASEINSDYFQIEKSENGMNWYKLGEVKAAGNSTNQRIYSFVDLNSRNFQTSYYRLLQFDLDGKSTAYGPVQSICIEEIENSFTFYPNPTQDLINIVIGDQLPSNSYFHLTDAQGRILMKIADLSESHQSKSISLSEFSSGCYYLQLISDQKLIQTEKVIKK